MGVFHRGVRNAFRNTVRSASVIFILALSICMALIMFMSLKTVQTKIDSVKSSIGNIVTVSPAGIRGFEGGGQLLTSENVKTVSEINNVTKVVSVLNDRVNNGTDTNLQSAIEAGNFGNRQGNRQFRTNDSSNTAINNSITQRTFTPPIQIVATSDLSNTASLNVAQFEITSGTLFDVNTSDNVALVGKDLATKNSLNVDSTFQAYSKDIKVVGIYDTGNAFTNSSLVVPLVTLQNLSDQSGLISEMVVQTSSIDSVGSAANDIKTALGNSADVVSQQDNSNSAIAPLQNIKTISLYGLIGSLVAGSIIILLTIVMIVRERRQEIGVLKAIGASNALVITQFSVESLVLTLTSSVLGILLGIVLSNPILNVLVNNSTSSTTPSGPGGGGGREFARLGAGIINGSTNSIRNLHNVIGIDIILYGLLAAIAIALIGSAIPSYMIAKVRPAEVLRSE